MLITYLIHRHQYFHGVNYENYAWNVAELRYKSAYNSAYNIDVYSYYLIQNQTQIAKSAPINPLFLLPILPSCKKLKPLPVVPDFQRLLILRYGFD
ncbi:hypothetical protein CDG77_28315 [Nostoc sp. 'Peltigera membranacea cyanobiont' 213]|nr:hypothetical protein CDG77_28315 [Nostoc sp. 'Peltigera membranacea cyanobiont' 213]